MTNRSMHMLLLGLLAAAACAQESGPLRARIANKRGTQHARRWTLAIQNDGSAAVHGVEIAAIRVTPNGGETGCTPAIRKPASFPSSVGSVPAGGSAAAHITIDFTGCSNRTQFSVEMIYGVRGGRQESLQRKSEFR
jgi:hypothetical protein